MGVIVACRGGLAALKNPKVINAKHVITQKATTILARAKDAVVSTFAPIETPVAMAA